MFDRVIPSNSMETLLVLLAGTGVALLILLLLDFVRNRLQNVLGTIVDERLSPPVVKAIVARAARAPYSARRGRRPRRSGGAQRVLGKRLSRLVRRAVGRGVRPGDLDLSSHPRDRRRARCRSHAEPGVAQRRAISRARWRACRRKGVAPRSTSKARCATRKCCRRWG